jgi:hypothetical protein
VIPTSPLLANAPRCLIKEKTCTGLLKKEFFGGYDRVVDPPALIEKLDLVITDPPCAENMFF